MRIQVIYGLLATTALLIGCGQGEKSPLGVHGAQSNVFRYPLAINPTTLDPARISDGDTQDVIQQCAGTLIEVGDDKQLHPLLIEKMPTIENGGKTYVFTLKKGVKFSNGKELTADDVKWTIERNANAALGSLADTYLNDIVGVNERLQGKKVPIGVEARDKYTVAFHLVAPRPYFLGKLTYPCAAPLCKDGTPVKEIVKPGELIGVGPFKLKDYKRDSFVLLEANKDYFEGAPAVNFIERPIMKDATTRFNKYRNGEIDMLYVERSDIPAIQADPKLKDQLHFFVRPSLFYLGLNMGKVEAFKDVRVRRAIAMAIDKEHIVKDILKGANQVANSILPPGMPGYRENAPAIKYNPIEAKRLITEAGYGPGGKKLSFALCFKADVVDIKLVSQNLAAQIKKNLGIDARVTPMEWGTFLQSWSQKKLDAVHMRWLNDYLDQQNSISIFFTKDGPENHLGYRDPKIDMLCAKADSVADPQERAKLYTEAEDIILQNGPTIPIYFQREGILIAPHVKGIRGGVMLMLPHTKVSVSR